MGEYGPPAAHPQVEDRLLELERPPDVGELEQQRSLASAESEAAELLFREQR
jgi:hypothetical protein